MIILQGQPRKGQKKQSRKGKKKQVKEEEREEEEEKEKQEESRKNPSFLSPLQRGDNEWQFLSSTHSGPREKKKKRSPQYSSCNRTAN
jgi:hypothetical protein